ncbi:MAG TPA: MBL fold metallo-hydrolase, partial [Candidatus Limnocylindrales bacterium]
MDLHFLGGATTVTGSQYLLETGRARVLIDCGMFQGSPNEAIRNRVPLAYDPATLDVMLLTHAHLDHCGLIPHVVKEGYRGRVIATKGTCELAELVMLDSGKLQEEFAKREARWEKKHPDQVAADDRKEQGSYDAAVALAEGRVPPPDPATAGHENVDDAPPPLTGAPDPRGSSDVAAGVVGSAKASGGPSSQAATGAPPSQAATVAPEAATIASAGVSEGVPVALASDHGDASTSIPDAEAELRVQPAAVLS